MTYPIHIAFCVNEAYFQYIAVTIRSIAESIQDKICTIHILTDFADDLVRHRLIDSFNDFNNIVIRFYNISDESLSGLKLTWSIYAWYRLLIPHYIPKEVHRILYLDADTIVVGDISPLFSMGMDGIAVAGVTDPKNFDAYTFVRCGYSPDKGYICSGVLLMNLDYWRLYNLTDVIISWAKDNNDIIQFPDQDAINVICKDNKILLPLKYGIINDFFISDYGFKHPYKEEVLECIDNPVIIHYAGQAPWRIEIANHLMQDRWLYYNDRLRHPAKRVYITKGWLFFKMKVWELFHPVKKGISLEDVRRKLVNTDDS